MARKLSPAQVEAHRQQNRECMRQARQSQRQRLQEMKTTVQNLEKQYNDLTNRSHTATSTKRLGAEKLLLQSMLKQKAAWRLQLQRIIDFEASSVHHEPQLQGVPEVVIEVMDELQAAREFGFQPLTEQDLTQIIMDNERYVSHVKNRLLSVGAQRELRTRCMQAFGWDIVQRVEDSVLEFVYTKRFHGLNVLDVMKKSWTNGLILEEFKKVKTETRHLQALQRVNSNAFVLARDVFSPSDISTFRSVFVRFLVEAAKDIAVESGPASSGEVVVGTGYILGTQSVDPGCPRPPSMEELSGKLAWADLSLSIEAFDVVNSVTGESYQQISWVGRTDYCSEEHARRNASDTLQGMLHWEVLVIAPALKLVSIPN
ncbi:hypothetical protein PHYSODRAFT_353102 [Phytophthora sojae]|uniref:BZIP domain-containing protein n=1 Tax=Phytophthora sojae (strain P6497) TaxID=1094619 RepID=G5ADY4_PHYSP|nr:hypothetical protein PHYSODRAFT_353102 [Phytophthora sojae]EGZ06386.1 hypothetical protein PHYSODRAFT_353102 [Phytophthora sojae]|eukprot:XP_009538283.1 hypothetical protein PHYSODRAFT_353102 [Phytophthora sojae]